MKHLGYLLVRWVGVGGLITVFVFSAPLFAAAKKGGNGNNRNGQPKVDVCHVHGDGTQKIISVAVAALPAHLGHGDSTPLRGVCDPNLIIVLGLQVNYSDCSARKVMEYRVQRAVKYADTVANPHYILAGKSNPTTAETCANPAVFEPPITEASVMADILIMDHAVDPDRITLEENSTSTASNAPNVKDIVDAMLLDGVNVASMALITSNYHMHRGRANGSDISAIRFFNDHFGAGTFVEGDNTFESSKMEQAAIWLANDLTMNEGWNTADHVRAVGDVDGDGKDDVVAMGNSSVFVAQSDGIQFDSKVLWKFCKFATLSACGGWNNSDHVRILGDVNGDGLADLVGFHNDDVFVHLSDGTEFGSQQVWSGDFAKNDGWSTTDHVRTVADVNADGKADIVGFGNNDIFVALSNGTGFDAKTVWLNDLTKGQNWKTTDHVRVLADVDGDARADIVAFGNSSIFVAESTGSAFATKRIWLSASREGPIASSDGNSLDFTKGQGYKVDENPRGAADIDGDGFADVWAIGTTGVFVALSTGELFEHVRGTWYYESQARHLGEAANFNHFTKEAGWTVADHPRDFGDVDGNGMADLVGFGNDHIFVSLTTEP